MEIKQLKEEKERLEKEIQSLLLNFTKKTSCGIASLECHRIIFDLASSIPVSYEIKAKITL